MRKNVLWELHLFAMIVLLFFLVFPILLWSEVQSTEGWVTRYNGPANSTDIARAIAIDSSGNIYVTGWSIGNGTYEDYTTVSYDSSGNQRWVARYNGPGNGSDIALAIAIDSSGNVYVTGDSYGGSRTSHDYATVAYDSSGNERWVARYNGPEIAYDIAYAITTDSSGNVYVTGGSSSGWLNWDYATVAYSPSGNELWVTRYNGPANSTDMASAITTDSSGHIYVTGKSVGWSAGSGTRADYATISYDSSGNERWVARYNGPANSDDLAYAIVTDSFGNIYVTGYSGGGSTTADDYATVSYNSSGNERWVARYNGPANKYDIARAIVTDSFGNIYVTGISGSSWGFYDYATVSYDPSGNQRWVARYNGPADSYDIPNVIAIDSSGNVYVTGSIYSSGTANDYTTVSYDSSGNERWVARYNGPANSNDFAYAIDTDTSGNVYVTGASTGRGTGSDYATIKYSQITKLPLGDSIEGKSDPGSFKVYVPSRYGGELTVSVVDSQTGFPTGNAELFYPDFNTPISLIQDMDPTLSVFKYEVPYDKFGWYYIKITGSTNYTVRNTFTEKGEVLPERKPWNISTWWPFSDVYDFGDSLTTEDDNYTIQEIKSLDDSVFPKYDSVCGLSGTNSAIYWETAKSVRELPRLSRGHYIYNGEDRDTHAEFDWRYDWNKVNGIENPGPYDFCNNAHQFEPDGNIEPNDTYNSTWWGHCNGWANASIIFQDPTLLSLRNGFTPDDVKGLFTEIGMRKTQSESVKQTKNKSEEKWTKEFHDFLRKSIREDKKAIWANLKAAIRLYKDIDEVWNHPVWYYEASMKEKPPQEGEIVNERLVDVTLSLKAADDLGTDVREDSPVTDRPWKYHLMYDKVGEIDDSGSGWDTFAVDEPGIKYYIPFLIHPKFDPNVFIGEGASNPYVTEDRIRIYVVYGEIRRTEW